MAHFVRDAGSDLTPTQHSNNLFFEHLKLMTLGKGMAGKQGSGKPIIMDFTLKANAGDTVRHTFIPYVHADPIRGQEKMILGNENSYDEYKLDVTVDVMNFAFARRGVMTEQRTLYNTRQILSKMIAQNFEQYNEDVIFKVLSGVNFNDDDSGTYLDVTDETDRVSGGNRIIRAAGSNSSTEMTSATSENVALNAAMAGTDTLSPQLIEDAAVMARTGNSALNGATDAVTNTYKLTPIKVGPNNEEVFIMYCSLKAARDLKRQDDWLAHSYALSERGFETSPIAKGALGVWDNVIIKPTERILEFGPDGTQYARNLLLGADAAFCGWAQTLDYTEEMEDHDTRLSVNGREIRGEKKVTFNGCDLGVAQIITASN